MEDRQSRLLLVMATILAALLGVLVLVEPPDESAADHDEHEPRWARLFPDVEGEDVQSMRWTGAAGAVSMSRTETGWALDAPAPGPADDARGDGIAASIARMEAADAIELTHDPGQYGLDEAGALEVVAETADGQLLRVVVGDDLPVGGGTYVLDAAGALRPTRLPLTTTFPTDPDDLRSRTVVRFAASAVERVELEGVARVIVLDKDTQGWWVEERGRAVDGIVAPAAAGRHRADEDRVSDLLSGLQSLQVAGLPDAPLALEGPSLAITLVAGGTSQVVTLGAGADGVPLVTGPALDGPAPADLSGLDPIVAVPGVAWRSRRLLPIRALSLDRVELSLGDRVLRATREGLTWSDPRTEALIDTLSDATVDRGPGEVPEPAGAPWGRVELAAGAAPAAAVELYQATPDGSRVARDVAGGAPFLVPAGSVRALEAALDPAD